MEEKVMKYVLLLRGLNVDGKNKVKMDDLKKLLQDAGFIKANIIQLCQQIGFKRRSA